MGIFARTARRLRYSQSPPERLDVYSERNWVRSEISQFRSAGSQRNAEPGESILVRNLNALRSSTPNLQRHREIRPRDGSNRRRRLSNLIALPLTLTQAHTWAAAVLIDELDACGFSCASNCQVISVDHRHTHTTKSHMQYHAADSGRNEM